MAWLLRCASVRVFRLRRPKTHPQPVLQRVRADEDGIGRGEEVLRLAAAGALPSEFGGLDEDERSRTTGTIRSPVGHYMTPRDSATSSCAACSRWRKAATRKDEGCPRSSSLQRPERTGT